MRFAKLFTAIAVIIMSISTSFANDTDILPAKNDVQAAGDAAFDELYTNSFAKELIPEGSVITLSEGLPCVFSSNFTPEMTFETIKQAPDTYFPLYPKIVGGSGSDTAWKYVGITEANNAKMIAIIATCIIGGITVIGLVFFVVRKKQKMISR